MKGDLVCHEMSPSPPKVFRSLSDGGNVFPVNRRLYSPTAEEGVKTATVSEAGVVRRVAINRTIPVGGPHIHCEPPPLYGSSHRPQSDPDVLRGTIQFSLLTGIYDESLVDTING
ncbi:uncharacterized protein LOC119587014 [Penaeus monodon]|uniref:uncharacterized protein LOC119587014 n=1 Tax=Penaeus monodon TaxID=6687 RepID=UPI0018A7473D|nr:uncharacterized protein LOC119587014 [Penaeus monodon]XP_037791690.1 uncharacterized protein LOC119587014 [Penaeus monodon]